MPTDQLHHFGPHGFGGPFHAMPFLGGLMFLLFLLTLLAVGFFLTKRGYLPRPGGPGFPGRFGAPEAEARKILAERFARGDISTDEFMERAAVLNWTPGVEPWSADKGKRKKH